MSGDTISVVVAARNASHTINTCVEALRAQTLDEPIHEIIVVDNNSTDNTAEVAAKAGATVVWQPKPGAAAARNAGIAAASGDIICVTDADCRPVPQWLDEVSTPLRKNRSLSAAKGTYRTDQSQLTARFVQLEYEDKYDILAKQETIDFIDTYSAAYRRHALLEVGGFDESMTYLEDQELSFRLAKSGHDMVFHPEAVVYHLHADSPLAYAKKKYLIGYWKAKVVSLYPNVAVRDSHTPQVMKIQMLLAMLLAVTIASAIISPLVGLVASLLVLVVFAMTTAPFFKKAWPKDRLVAIASPPLLFVRAVALSAGYIVGSLSVLRARSARNPNPGLADEQGQSQVGI